MSAIFIPFYDSVIRLSPDSVSNGSNISVEILVAVLGGGEVIPIMMPPPIVMPLPMIIAMFLSLILL
jgi:hypothetical protein